MNSEAHGASQLDLCPLSLCHLLCLATVPHFVLPFTANIEVEALLVALNLTQKFELHLSFSFPHTIPACLGNVSKFFPWYTLPASTCHMLPFFVGALSQVSC